VKRKVCYGIGYMVCCWAAANLYSQSKRAIRRRNGHHIQDGTGCSGIGHRSKGELLPGSGKAVNRHASARNRCSTWAHGLVYYIAACAYCAQIVLGLGSIDNLYHDWINGAKGISQDVQNWVQDGINWVVSGISYDLGLVTDAWHDAVNDLAATVAGISQLASEAWAGVEQLATEVGAKIEAVAADAWKGVTDAISAALNDLSSWVHDAIADVSGAIDSLSNFVYTDIWGPFSRALDAVGHDISTFVDKAVKDFYSDVILPIARGLADVVTVATDAWDWVEHTGVDIATTVYKAADWLAWMGIHSIEDIGDLITGGFNDLSLSQILSYRSNAESYIDTFADWIEKALG
jgi:hypothetical protein